MKKIVCFVNLLLKSYPAGEDIYDYNEIDYLCPTGMIPFKFNKKR